MTLTDSLTPDGGGLPDIGTVDSADPIDLDDYGPPTDVYLRHAAEHLSGRHPTVPDSLGDSGLPNPPQAV